MWRDALTSAWLALAGADPAERAREIARAHAAFLGRAHGGAVPDPLGGDIDIDDAVGHAPPGPLTTAVREVVRRSWVRSARAHVDPDAEPPVTLGDAELADHRAQHPLAAVIDVLRDLVGAPADAGANLMAVSDEAGRLLWVEGDRRSRGRAEAFNFVEGAAWDETHAGTNAPGTALAVDEPVQIFATEHFQHTVQGWSCAAAPIHDPATGRVLGVVDMTGGTEVAHPHTLALVRAAALAAEATLAWSRTGPAALWLPGRPTPARLEALGRGEGVLRLGGRRLRLNRRHTEILIILSAHPEGMRGEQLAEALYTGDCAKATVRVELSRLRNVVGGLLGSRPYRLMAPIEADYLDVAAALRRGDTAAAAAAYRGDLLPSSEAPGVAAQRAWLEARLRSALLACDDARLLAGFAERFGFEDLHLWERLADLAPDGSAHRALAAARIAGLRAEYGLDHRVHPPRASGDPDGPSADSTSRTQR